ncbi:MAG: glycosyltransferase [Chthonomonas sp.]|nr:glycosyltransferase [Chthonomonas sp.]
MESTELSQNKGLPKISVITPSFNQGEFIEETIQSVLNQRYPNLEYIVIDGGSTDQTVSILERYRDHFAYCVSEKDNGQTDAINKGIEKATGDIVAVLNSDDVYLPGALDFVADQFMKDNTLRWMTAPSLYWGPDRAQARIDMMPVQIPEWKGGWLLRQCIPHPSTFLLREVIERHGTFDESFYFAMDYEYWCRLAFGGERLVGFDRPISGYRLHGVSKSVTARDRMAADSKRILDTYLPRLRPAEQKRVRSRLRSELAFRTLLPLLDLLKKGDQQGAMTEWKKRVAENPSVRFTRYWATTWLRIKLNWI